MMAYFFDTYALIELIRKSPAYERFLDEPILTSELNLAELHHVLLRQFGKKTARYWTKRLQERAMPVRLSTMLAAMEFRAEHKSLSFFDATGYLLAKELGLRFLTGDKGFLGLPDAEIVAENSNIYK